VPDRWLTIGEVEARTGVASSAIRFYEDEGMIASERTVGGQRRFKNETLRRIAFIRVAQRVGLSLPEIREALGSLPSNRTPTKADWARLGRTWRPRLDERIKALEDLRDELTSCIGCGCLSLRACSLYNPKDAAAVRGPGPRYLLGDSSTDVLREAAR